MDKTVHVKLVAKQSDLYSKYVFFDLENKGFILATVLPNWEEPGISIGDKGYATLEIAEAGESYYNRETESTQVFKFSRIYFKSFVAENNSTDLILL